MANVAAVVSQAIARSIVHNEIVHIEAGPVVARGELAEVHEALLAECEDGADNDGVTEYWGTNESGREWRVHVEVVGSDARYAIESRHASGSSHWDSEPDASDFASRYEAEKAIEALEAEDDEGAALEYRVVEAVS